MPKSPFSPNFISDTGFAADMANYELDRRAAVTGTKPIVHEEWPLEIGVVRTFDRTQHTASWKGFVDSMSGAFDDRGTVTRFESLAVDIVTGDEIVSMLNDTAKYRSLSRDPRGEQARRRVAQEISGCLTETIDRFRRSQADVEWARHDECDGTSRVFEQELQTELWNSADLEIAEVPQIIGSHTLALAFEKPDAAVLSENRAVVLDVLHDDFKLNVSQAQRTDYVPVLPILVTNRSLVGQMLELPSTPYSFLASPPRVIKNG